MLACEGTGVLPCVPKTVVAGRSTGFFTRQDFVFDAENDHYTCPAGEKLTRGAVRSDRKDDIDIYRHLTACFTCPLKPRCTPDKLKRIKRWQHEGVLDKMQARLDRMPDAMGVRRQTVEHPFGTLKSWMGSTHFLTRTLEKVRTEMSLHVLAYNHEANDPDLRRRTADGGDQGLIKPSGPSPNLGPGPKLVIPATAAPAHQSKIAFLHGLGRVLPGASVRKADVSGSTAPGLRRGPVPRQDKAEPA